MYCQKSDILIYTYCWPFLLYTCFLLISGGYWDYFQYTLLSDTGVCLQLRAIPVRMSTMVSANGICRGCFSLQWYEIETGFRIRMPSLISSRRLGVSFVKTRPNVVSNFSHKRLMWLFNDRKGLPLSF